MVPKSIPHGHVVCHYIPHNMSNWISVDISTQAFQLISLLVSTWLIYSTYNFPFKIIQRRGEGGNFLTSPIHSITITCPIVKNPPSPIEFLPPTLHAIYHKTFIRHLTSAAAMIWSYYSKYEIIYSVTPHYFNVSHCKNPIYPPTSIEFL